MSAPDARPHAREEARHLSAAVRAQTILAACRCVVARFADDGPAPEGPRRPVAALVEWDGVPHLLSNPRHRLPSGTIHLTCDSEDPGLGTLVLRGRCDAPRPATAVPGLSEHLLATRRTRPPTAQPLDIAQTVVAPVSLEQVQVVMHASHHARRTLPVPIDLFRRARPDLWTVHRTDITTHLDQHHQDGLCRLVHARTVLPAVSAVVVRDVGPRGMSLACLTSRGVTGVTLPFDPPLTNPHHLAHWLRNQLPAEPPPPEEKGA